MYSEFDEFVTDSSLIEEEQDYQLYRLFWKIYMSHSHSCNFNLGGQRQKHLLDLLDILNSLIIFLYYMKFGLVISNMEKILPLPLDLNDLFHKTFKFSNPLLLPIP